MDMTLENPTSLVCAQSRIAVHKAPDCDTKARLPILALPWLNVALRPISGRITPKQLGPIKRMLWRLAFSSTARSSFIPAAPASPNPAVIMTAAFTLCLPHSSMISGTDCGGVAMMAKSTGSCICDMEA